MCQIVLFQICTMAVKSFAFQSLPEKLLCPYRGGRLAKVSCILRHLGIQLILAYCWARPAVLVAGKGRGGCFYFFCFFTFILVLFLPCPSGR